MVSCSTASTSHPPTVRRATDPAGTTREPDTSCCSEARPAAPRQPSRPRSRSIPPLRLWGLIPPPPLVRDRVPPSQADAVPAGPLDLRPAVSWSRTPSIRDRVEPGRVVGPDRDVPWGHPPWCRPLLRLAGPSNDLGSGGPLGDRALEDGFQVRPWIVKRLGQGWDSPTWSPSYPGNGTAQDPAAGTRCICRVDPGKSESAQTETNRSPCAYPYPTIRTL